MGRLRFGCRVYKVSVDTGLSCPNRDGTKGVGGCDYCVSSALLPKAFTSGADVKGQLLEGIEYVKKRHKASRVIAYFQVNTSTHAPVNELERLIREAVIPEVACIAVSTRPDCLGDDVVALLSEIKKERPLWIELGLQSANDATLEMVNRGHTSAEFKDAVIRGAAAGIDICAHAIIGLPGEGRADIIKTMRLFIASLPVWGIKFHQLQVLKATKLEEAWLRGEVKTLTPDEYADLVVECLEVLAPEVVVHRLSGDAPLRYIAAPKWGGGKFRIRWYKANKIRAFSQLKESLPSPDNLYDSSALIDAESVLTILNTLTADKQEIVKLRFWGDLKFSEIAEKLNKNEAAVKKMFTELCLS